VRVVSVCVVLCHSKKKISIEIRGKKEGEEEKKMRERKEGWRKGKGNEPLQLCHTN
jgi:hypothetical protein